jgi:hypothetical protein
MSQAQTPTHGNTFFYSCGEWSLVFKEELQLEVSENKVLMKQLTNLNVGCYTYMKRKQRLSRSRLIVGEVMKWDGSETHEMRVSCGVC